MLEENLQLFTKAIFQKSEPMENISVSVVHLVWIPYGTGMFKDFVDSYKTFSAGYQHSLIILFNGVTNENETSDYHTYIQKAGIQYQSFYLSKGQDLEAYRWIANQLTNDYILFVNSYSRFMADEWLFKYLQSLKVEKVGLIGATASWQSYYSTVLKKYSWRWTKISTLKENIAKYKLLLKATFLWQFYFAPFPNPHIRTNSFFIDRKLFLLIRYENPKMKIDAYRIESGKNSITNQVKKMGLKVIIVDKYGELYEEDSWRRSKVFWTSRQENLLISDNQTELYTNSNDLQKELLEKLAWG